MEKNIKIINKDGEMREITIPLPKNLELKDNDRIMKINGKWYKVTYPEGSKIMEEDIKVLESYVEKLNEGYCNECNELCNMYGAPSRPELVIKEAIENLINRNKELEEEHQKRIMLALNKELVIVNSKMYTIDKELYNDLLNDTVNNYIPKSKVREKIEELENSSTYGYVGEEWNDRNVVELLEELLQKGDTNETKM